MALNTDTAPPAPAAPRSSHGAQAPSRPAMTATPTPDHPPLRAPITPYRLFNFLLLLSLRRPNAVFSPIGRSASAGDLDWAGALAAGVMYVRPCHVELAPTLTPRPVTPSLYVLSGWAGVADLRWGRWFFRKDLSRPTFDFVQSVSNLSAVRILRPDQSSLQRTPRLSAYCSASSCQVRSPPLQHPPPARIAY